MLGFLRGGLFYYYFFRRAAFAHDVLEAALTKTTQLLTCPGFFFFSQR